MATFQNLDVCCYNYPTDWAQFAAVCTLALTELHRAMRRIGCSFGPFLATLPVGRSWHALPSFGLTSVGTSTLFLILRPPWGPCSRPSGECDLSPVCYEVVADCTQWDRFWILGKTSGGREFLNPMRTRKREQGVRALEEPVHPALCSRSGFGRETPAVSGKHDSPVTFFSSMKKE